MKKYVLEMIGTMFLILIGCGTAAVAGSYVGVLGIAIAFGIPIIAMAYTIGPITGCHVNPAVSLGVYFKGDMDFSELIGYILSQIIGALIGTFILFIILNGSSSGLGINYVQPEYSLLSAFVFEFVFTFFFVLVILGVTQKGAENSFAGLAIGITLIGIHLVGIQITGTSVNPARSIGPAIITMDQNALKDLWLFIVAPLTGGALAGLLHKIDLFKIEK